VSAPASVRGSALRYALAGAIVVAVDIDSAAAEATASRSAEAGAPFASVHRCDLTDPDGVRRLATEIEDAHGRVDTLVNAGAIQPHMGPVWEMDYETAFRPTMVGEVDLVWPLLRASGRGAVINFASVNSFRGSRHMGMVAHTAGKGAILAMSRQLAIEGGPDNIRVNTIAPGLVQTDATKAAGATDGDLASTIVSRTLLGRLGVPDDVTQCALWLGSDESSWVTGANVPIDGGSPLRECDRCQAVCGTAGLGLPGARPIRQGASDLTMVNNSAGNGDTGLAALLAKGRVRKVICSFPRQKDSPTMNECQGGTEVTVKQESEPWKARTRTTPSRRTRAHTAYSVRHQGLETPEPVDRGLPSCGVQQPVGAVRRRDVSVGRPGSSRGLPGRQGCRVRRGVLSPPVRGLRSR